MSGPEVVRHVLVPVEEVWAALIEPRTYPHWLVGCREIRSVDDGWPARGTRFHHRVGLVGPATVADSTRVQTIDAPRRLALEVRARPFIKAIAEFDLSTTGRGTEIKLTERPIGVFSPLGPLLAGPTVARNKASLNALVAYLNEQHLR